jgi:hypothetical protein
MLYGLSQFQELLKYKPEDSMPRFATKLMKPEEVMITREGDYARIDYKNPSNGGGVNIHIGPKIQTMSDAEILALHNEWVSGIMTLRREYVHSVVEIPDTRPQISHSKSCDQWVPRGDVLRCVISSDDSQDRQPAIQIDDKMLSLEEFGRLLLTHDGWGMRIMFVPDDMICEQPEIEVNDSTARVRHSYKRKRQVATRKLIELAHPAETSIDTLLKLFLEEGSETRTKAQQSRYSQTITELKDCLNDYGYQDLDDSELALLENRNRNGSQHSFCELFGAEHLLNNLAEYLCYRQIRQCASDQQARQRAHECVAELLNWLSTRGKIHPKVADLSMWRVHQLEQDLPAADRARKLIATASQKSDMDPGKLDCDDYMEFDIWVISRTEGDCFWFQLEGLEAEWGPAHVPARAAQLLKPGWQIACAFARLRGKLRVAGLVNIYPEARLVDLDAPYRESASC